MRDVASWGKTSMGWFYGMKLHVVVNHQGELERFTLTPGHVHDVNKAEELLSGLQGLAAGDRGYISKDLAAYLEEDGLKLITTLRKNMKPVERSDFEKEYLRRRSLVETVLDQLEHEFKIKHTRHRSPVNFVIHTLTGLAAYCFKPNKPTMSVDIVDLHPTPTYVSAA
jgi:IS5 family transposase